MERLAAFSNRHAFDGAIYNVAPAKRFGTRRASSSVQRIGNGQPVAYVPMARVVEWLGLVEYMGRDKLLVDFAKRDIGYERSTLSCTCDEYAGFDTV